MPNTLPYCISNFTVEFLKEGHSAPIQFCIYIFSGTVWSVCAHDGNILPTVMKWLTGNTFAIYNKVECSSFVCSVPYFITKNMCTGHLNELIREQKKTIIFKWGSTHFLKQMDMFSTSQTNL